MKAPEPWRVRHGHAPEAELHRLNRRFQAVSRRLEQRTHRQRLQHCPNLLAAVLIAANLLFWRWVLLAPARP